jgi:small conductance mechanosensitive channel
MNDQLETVDQVRRTAIDLAMKFGPKVNPRVLKDPAPVIQVAMLADSSVNIAVRVWTNVVDYVAVTGEVNRGILENFRGRNIVIPFPQQEVRILGNAA